MDHLKPKLKEFFIIEVAAELLLYFSELWLKCEVELFLTMFFGIMFTPDAWPKDDLLL